MTKKEYFQKNAPLAALCINVFAYYVLYGIDDYNYAYITYETDNGVKEYHRLLIRYAASGDEYVLLNGRRLKLAEFCRI